MSIDAKYYNENIKNINNVAFNIFTNDMIKKYSSIKETFGITVPDSYDGYEPKKGGLVDLHLGTCDIYLNCLTCGLNCIDCPGHFGHLELAEPVYHFGYITYLLTFLKLVCHKCSNILFKKTNEIVMNLKNKSSKQKIKELKELTKNLKFCAHCGSPVCKVRKEVNVHSATIRIVIEKEVGNVVFDETSGTSLEQKKIIKEYITPRDCYNILININDNDCRLLGFDPEQSRPEDLILTRFPVPPVCIRPTAKIDFMSSSTMEDSLTLKIADIVTSNNRIRNQQNKDKLTNIDTHTLLQYHIATYFDNESASLPKSEFKTGNKPTKSISDRIKSKGGRVRNNLMGKRVDFSGRSVITSDPNISIEQVGVPLKIAKDLTIPEEVTPQNIDHLSKLVLNGRDIYPGANFVFRKQVINGKEITQKIDLKYRKDNLKLAFGNIVERHIINDDYVLFNRQPTLHKPSMMGHKVHILNRDDCNTLRMNVCVTGPYNADFDGDEMNIHLGQSIQAKNELKRIANVKLQIIGAKDSNPIIGCVQDTLVGAYLLTTKNLKFTYQEVANLLCVTNIDIPDIPKKKEITGLELFSYIIPNINIEKQKEGKTNFLIDKGIIKKGYLNKSQLSTKKNSLIHYIWDKYGPTETTDFIDNSQKLILKFLLDYGFTIGLKDMITKEEINEQVEEFVKNSILQQKYQMTQVENDEDKLPINIIEQQIVAELGAISLNTSKIILDSFDEANNLKIFINCGSKGSPINVAQIAGCVGQVLVNGERIKKKVNNRSLPYFHQDDDTPLARGFVKSNFISGLEPSESIFHTMAGREGLIDTAIKTAETGYIQRKLIKALEDLKVFYDGTVRTSKNMIVQYIYGENGINQIKQTQIKLNTINKSNNEIDNEYKITSEESKKFKFNFNTKKYNEDIIRRIKQYRDDLRLTHFNSTQNYKVLTNMFNIPVNIIRITLETKKQKTISSDLDPYYIVNELDKIILNYDNRLIVKKKLSKILEEDDITMKYLFKIALFEYINPRKCIFDLKLSKSNFDEMIKNINKQFLKAIIDPGEMVGIVAAQSVGEPTSQMTLNTKHFAGVAGKGTANMGLSRIKEILSYSKNIKTPQMTIYFDKKYSKNKSDVNIISSYLKYVNIKVLLEKAEIIYVTNNNDELSNVIKKDNVKNPFYISNKKEDIDNLPILFRLKINLESLVDKETSLLDVKTKFITYWYKNLSNLKAIKRIDKDIISKITNLAILDNNIDVIHIRFNMTAFNYNILTSFLNLVINTVTLKGMNSIDEVNIIDERKINIGKDDEIIVDNEYCVTTNGINLHELKLVKGIDLSRVKINDIHQIFLHYGIEAARQTIINELILTYNSGGSNVNHTHISLLVDLMTFNGNIVSVDRHGLTKIDSDPMSKASFEKTMEHFINAAIYNEKDSIKSVSSRIMIGRSIDGGTSSFDISLDIDKIKNSEYIENEAKGRNMYEKIELDMLFDDLITSSSNEIDFLIPE